MSIYVSEFAHLQLYIKNSDINSEQADEVLEEILDHILEAQKNGEKIDKIIGNNLEEFCNSVIENLQKPSLFSTIKFFVGVYIISIWNTLINKCIFNEFFISWLDFTINPILVFCSPLIFRKLTKKKILNNRVHVFLPMQLIIMLISMMLLIFDYNMKTNLLIRPLNLYIFALTISCVFVAVMYKFSDIFKTKFYF
ncbi:hypothetical protein P9726_15215 [Geobacillus stearothermophilus]|uniref:hypothetical protein n=2 Tax=Geobacillus stearothermophilus TaxID=1422 RepID=UPI002E1E4223|nr:hypothetical protein [Geobacillus stearothermophilus]